MSRRPAVVGPTGRAGFALALALMVLLLLEGFAAATVLAVAARARLGGALRISVEGDLALATALAEWRVSQDSLLSALVDGDSVGLRARTGPDGWMLRGTALRRGSVILVIGEATKRDAAARVIGWRRATLLMGVGVADTVRVSGYRSRY